MKLRILICLASLICVAVLNGETLWNATSGDWDTDALWNPQVEPTALDIVKIYNGGTCTVSQVGEVAYELYLGYGNNNTGTLHVVSGSLDVDDEDIWVGYSGGTGHLIQDGGTINLLTSQKYVCFARTGSHGTYDFSGGNINSSGYIYFGWGGDCEVNMSGNATFTNHLYRMLVPSAGNSIVDMADQSKIVAEGGLYLGSSGHGQIIIADDASVYTSGTRIGDGATGLGELTLTNNGSYHVELKDFSIGYGAGSTGIVNIVGGEFVQRLTWIKTMKLGDGGYGIVNMGNEVVGGVLTNESDGKYGDVVVGTTATSDGIMQGRGTVYFYRTLDNNGRIIADGYGNENMLDLSRFGTGYTHASYPNVGITNSINNTTNHGWFAVNQGELLLPDVDVSGAGSYNWGEFVGDASIDLVNSVRLTLADGLGDLTGKLLAADRSDVPAGLENVIGVWSFSGVTPSSSVLSFRYDDTLAYDKGLSSDKLAVYQFADGEWSRVTYSVDSVNKIITTTSVSTLSTFAVAAAPALGSIFIVQ